MSVKSPIEPPPESGRISASGMISDGIFKIFVIGEINSVSAAIAPDSRSIAAAERMAISAGNIEITVFNPSSTPSIKVL